MNDWDLFYFATMALPLVLAVGCYVLFKKRKQSGQQSKAFVLAWNVMLSCFILALFFWAGETYFRFWVDTTDSFALNKITNRWGKRHHQVNNMNVRDNVDYKRPLTPGKRRITFIGDSFTSGHGVKEVNQRFVNLVRAKQPYKEIQCIAANGFDTNTEFHYLQKFIEEDQVEMDVVVLVYNLNDIAYLLPQTKAIYDRIYDYKKDLNFLVEQSYLVNTLYFRWITMQDEDLSNYYSFVKDSYFNQYWTQQTGQLDLMRQYCASRGVKLMVVTFPLLHQFDDTYLFGPVHEQVGLYWRNNGIPYLDLLPAFRKHKSEDLTVNNWDAHPNERAHAIAAEAINKFLDDNL